MQILQAPQLDELSPCPYLPNRQKQFQYFFAQNLSDTEISFVLSMGWRKFGAYYFRPLCHNCQDCIPIRVLTNEFKPSKSQRKNLRKNQAIHINIGPLTYSKRAYEIYMDHSHNRFGQESSLDNFLFNFYTPSCPALQSEYYLDDRLIAVGYLDQGVDCLSSIYFVFDSTYSSLGLGTFSILKEIEYAKSIGLPYYYLGYYIRDCQSMNYKDRFQPREHFDWRNGQWCRI